MTNKLPFGVSTKWSSGRPQPVPFTQTYTSPGQILVNNIRKNSAKKTKKGKTRYG